MAPPTKRKRQRKRKRRNDISSSSSSSSSSESESDGPSLPTQVAKTQVLQKDDVSDLDSSDESSSSSASSSSLPAAPSKNLPEGQDVEMEAPELNEGEKKKRASRSPSPQLRRTQVPSFLPADSNLPDEIEGQRVFKEKFRKFWMEKVADGFKDDLEQIRKEPNLTPSRIALLIDSLASGADVITNDSDEENETSLILEEL